MQARIRTVRISEMIPSVACNKTGHYWLTSWWDRLETKGIHVTTVQSYTLWYDNFFHERLSSVKNDKRKFLPYLYMGLNNTFNTTLKWCCASIFHCYVHWMWRQNFWLGFYFFWKTEENWCKYTCTWSNKWT